MKITYELYGKSFFHTDCIAGNKNGIMKPIIHKSESSLMECQHCGARGYYPVGAIGEIEVDEQTKSNQSFHADSKKTDC